MSLWLRLAMGLWLRLVVGLWLRLPRYRGGWLRLVLGLRLRGRRRRRFERGLRFGRRLGRVLRVLRNHLPTVRVHLDHSHRLGCWLRLGRLGR